MINKIYRGYLHHCIAKRRVIVPGVSSEEGGSWEREFIVNNVACEYSRLSFASATTCETRRKTSAIHRQKFHTDDVNVRNPDRSADWLTEQFCIISSTIIQCCDVQKSNSENLSCPSLKIFRVCVQSVRPMFQAPGSEALLVLSALRRFSSIC